MTLRHLASVTGVCFTLLVAFGTTSISAQGRAAAAATKEAAVRTADGHPDGCRPRRPFEGAGVIVFEDLEHARLASPGEGGVLFQKRDSRRHRLIVGVAHLSRGVRVGQLLSRAGI